MHPLLTYTNITKSVCVSVSKDLQLQATERNLDIFRKTTFRKKTGESVQIPVKDWPSEDTSAAAAENQALQMFTLSAMPAIR